MSKIFDYLFHRCGVARFDRSAFLRQNAGIMKKCLSLIFLLSSAILINAQAVKPKPTATPPQSVTSLNAEERQRQLTEEKKRLEIQRAALLVKYSPDYHEVKKGNNIQFSP